MNAVLIDGKSLNLEDVVKVARHGCRVELTEGAMASVRKSREYVDRLVREGRVVYGITTGFGEFSKVSIANEQTELLQKNLIVSHACGIGRHLPEDSVRALMLLRINALSQGFSGIRLETVQALIDMLNTGVVPAVPEKGSLGASGDLAPLSHMVLPLMGLGEAYIGGELMPGAKALERAGLTPVVLTSKEGLALINGTQVMTGIGALTVYDALNVLKLFDIAAALVAEAQNGVTDAYISDIHEIRPHQGQLDTASNMLRLLEGSERTTRSGQVRVQDAYSLRCVPQIHGASKDAVRYVHGKVAVEMNSVTDNPIILADKDMAISGGNFHGQPVALSFDFLGIALAELANVSERRIERLVNPALSGLPAFLTRQGGLHSGFMIAQYSAAALVSENKVLAHPASVDSIPSSAGQEDHVSMGTIAARKAREIYFNTSRVLAIELVAAAQAIDLNEKYQGRKLGKGTQAAYDTIRSVTDTVVNDRELYLDFEKVAALVDSNRIVEAVEAVVGELA
ncbi:MAG: histidine ammonia-lyase [Defluviitaleaceae bacterium]|nr:histidine ammonia-lyase [Defluviitaleaceae bacterium]